jgi:hypothetical protein
VLLQFRELLQEQEPVEPLTLIHHRQGPSAAATATDEMAFTTRLRFETAAIEVATLPY